MKKTVWAIVTKKGKIEYEDNVIKYNYDGRPFDVRALAVYETRGDALAMRDSISEVYFNNKSLSDHKIIKIKITT